MKENLKPKSIFEPLRKLKNQHKIQKNFDREKRRRMMIIGASIGLILCLTSLMIFKKDMSEEIVGILYMITGVFGACLMEAYNFEFRLFKKNPRKKHKITKD